MGNASTKTANIFSENMARLDRPYEPAQVQLIARHNANGTYDVMFFVEAQILCRDYENERINIKFDESPVRHFECRKASDGNSGYIFISPATRFVEQLKNSKTLLVELTLYDNGTQQFRINTDGFDFSKIQ